MRCNCYCYCYGFLLFAMPTFTFFTLKKSSVYSKILDNIDHMLDFECLRLDPTSKCSSFGHFIDRYNTSNSISMLYFVISATEKLPGFSTHFSHMEWTVSEIGAKQFKKSRNQGANHFQK